MYLIRSQPVIPGSGTLLEIFDILNRKLGFRAFRARIRREEVNSYRERPVHKTRVWIDMKNSFDMGDFFNCVHF